MNAYGVREVNPIDSLDKAMRERIDHSDPVQWNDPALARITRFRLLTDADFPAMDVSYCYGVLKDGTPVRVELPFSQLPKRRWKSALIQHAKRDGVHAAGLGMFDNVSILY